MCAQFAVLFNQTVSKYLDNLEIPRKYLGRKIAEEKYNRYKMYLNFLFELYILTRICHEGFSREKKSRTQKFTKEISRGDKCGACCDAK